MSTKKWILIIAAVLALSIAGILLIPRGGTRVEITQDGELLRTIDLSAVASAEEFTVTYQGRSNTIRVEPGRICVIDADCPDHICMQTGWLPECGEPIVCLPNRLIIRMAGSGADAVSR